MKAQILKIAGVKNEAEFYKKYPTEEAFMKKHGKQLEKAQSGIKKKFTVPQMTFNVDKSPQGLLNNYFNSTKQGSLLTTPYEMGKSSNLTTTGETTTLAPLTNGQKSVNMLANQAGTLVGLTQSIIDKYGRQTDELNNYEKFSDMIAGMPRPALNKPKYVRPEYSPVENPQKYGVPMAQDGASVGGNPTEIQNTYNPYDIYTDLGYTPLGNNSNPKQYQNGGGVGGGGFDPTQFMGAAGSIGGALGSLAGGDDFAQTEEGQLGSSAGGLIGTAIGGPVGGLIGSGIGGLAGGLIGGKKNKQMKFQKNRLETNLAAGAYTNSLQNGPLSYFAEDGAAIPAYEEGGYMNPEYNPQVIAKFGDYSMDQLLAPPHDADMLRAGGHLKEYTPPSETAMYTGRDLPYQMENGGQMAMGGDLQVHRGKAETISYNPFLPNNGETVMFRGPSHDNGGMPITFGQNGVEVEGGEPAQILQDGGSMEDGDDGNLVVFGNMIADKFAAEHVGDYSIAGKRYKHIEADYSKQEVKANKVLEKAMALINEKNPSSLTKNTAETMYEGGMTTLKMIADKKKNLATVQNAILDTAKEFGVESDALAKGKIKPIKPNDPYAAEFGAELDMAKKGKKVNKKKSTAAPVQTQTSIRDLSNLSGLYDNAIKTKDAMAIGKFQRAALNTLGAGEIEKLTGIKNDKKFAKNFVSGVLGKETDAVNKAILQKIQGRFMPAAPVTTDPIQYPAGEQPQQEQTIVQDWVPQDLPFLPGLSEAEVDAKNASVSPAPNAPKDEKKKGNNWYNNVLTGVNSMLPYLRPSNQMQLDPSQLSGEMLALATNQLEPVYAQSYQPQLAQPYSVSLQDMRNQVTSDSRAAQRMAQNNPAAAAMIAAASSEAKNKINAEEFRANQGEQSRVAELNRQTMNDAQMKNLGIYDQQYQRQSAAKSNTKQQAIAALNSINDKVLKNKLENRQLSTYENMYNYRYTPNGVAYNVNPLAQFNPYGSGSSGSLVTGQLEPGKDFSLNRAGKIIGVHSVGKDDTVTGKNGKKISKGDSKNGSIVKAIKGL